MSLDEVRAAFDTVYGANPENPPFELIGFDACLMATVDTLSSIHGFSRYMVASQEIEPGCGWNYSGWVGALAKNPAMGGAALGKTICDTYMEGCKEYDVEEMATLSLSDVSKAPALTAAYGAYGVEALQAAASNPRQLFSTLARGADASENYGGNTREQGYYDMVDLGELVKNTQSAMPATSSPVLSALDDCVLYHVNGSYRPNGLGLSCYHPYDADAEVSLARLRPAFRGAHAHQMPLLLPDFRLHARRGAGISGRRPRLHPGALRRGLPPLPGCHTERRRPGPWLPPDLQRGGPRRYPRGR